MLVGCPAAKDTALDPTLTNVQAEVFDKSCAFSSCHGSAGGSGKLDLTPGESHGELVEVAADYDPTQTLVVPGAPDESFLMTKLFLSEPTDAEGDPMPQTGGALDDEKIALVEAWIAAGAKDD